MKKNRKVTQGPATRDQLDQMRTELDVQRSKLYAAKIAYLNRTPFQGHEVTFEDLKGIATEYIRRSYNYQKAVYGKVKVRISLSKLLRHR